MYREKSKQVDRGHLDNATCGCEKSTVIGRRIQERSVILMTLTDSLFDKPSFRYIKLL